MVEVLIVIAIAVPIMMAMMGILGSSFRARNANLELERVQNVAITIFQDLSQELHNSATADIGFGAESDTLSVYSADNDLTAEYTVVQERLLKNQAAFTQEGVEVKSFIIDDLGKSGGVPLIRVTLALESKKRPDVKVEKEMSISLRKKSYSSDEGM